MEWGQLKEVVEELKKRTAMQAYSLVIAPEKKPDIFSSKFGGVPYWDTNRDYPVDGEGKKLMLLAQINLDQAEVEEPLPTRGMLQFFIGRDDVFGMDFDKQDEQNTFRVVYHETINYNISREEILALQLSVSTEENEEYTPVFKEAVVDIIKKTVYMGTETYQFDKLFGDIVKEKLGKDIGQQTAYSVMDEDAYDKLIDEISNSGHWLLGYPYFTQSDPREYEEKYRVYDTLLFQMDSDYINNEDYVLWGDCGVGNFFINGEDLKKRDFSKVLYNWDCC